MICTYASILIRISPISTSICRTYNIGFCRDNINIYILIINCINYHFINIRFSFPRITQFPMFVQREVERCLIL